MSILSGFNNHISNGFGCLENSLFYKVSLSFVYCGKKEKYRNNNRKDGKYFLIIIHTELLVTKIKSCIPRALWQGGQYYYDIALALCDQSFNIDLRLRYVVRIHSSEIRAMPHPP